MTSQNIYRPVLVSVFPKIGQRPDWTGLSNTMADTEEEVRVEEYDMVVVVLNRKIVAGMSRDSPVVM